jgi:cell division protein FtsB
MKKRSILITIAVAYLLWITFFDQSNLLQLYRLKQERKELRNELAFYRDQISLLQEQKSQLLGNLDKLETFAREQYYMKKEKEDVFVVSKKD